MWLFILLLIFAFAYFLSSQSPISDLDVIREREKENGIDVLIQPTEQTDHQYQAKARLNSTAENEFYTILTDLLPLTVDVAQKVRIADLVEVSSKSVNKDRLRNLSKIAQKHVDFVLTRKSDSTILAVIELDESSHDTTQRRERDQFVNEVFMQVGIPIVRYRQRGRLSYSRVIATLSRLNIPELQ
jgi:hypothetical protein